MIAFTFFEPWQKTVWGVEEVSEETGGPLTVVLQLSPRALPEMGATNIIVISFLSLVSASLRPQQEASKEIEQSIQELVTERNATQRLLFDDIFFGFSDTDAEEKETPSNCSCKCGLVNQEIRIVGGRPTGVNRYPWVARLVYDGQFHCGGSLLNGDHDQYVTTDSPAIMRAVSSIIRHRNFDVNSYNHDIALLKLRKPVSFTKNIRPVCLPNSAMDPAGKVGTVVGWGRTSEGGNLANIVQEVQVPILTLQQCRATKYRPSRITPNMVCAGKGIQDSCQGDSGGPLLLNTEGEKFEIVGIVSWGVGCGRPGYPGVYTRVTSYLNWVRRNMKDACACVS
ncbi:trypsin-1-like isoform X2 [Cimex lectularius]|uniref:Vitamin K-dependent protein C n=1 Tax=Cimex lectularius TaxID=79782 RepID=A0A8I6RY85_CIMLE|nr:trypsin-1-like isoform X2 [Cimex lectularius]